MTSERSPADWKHQPALMRRSEKRGRPEEQTEHEDAAPTQDGNYVSCVSCGATLRRAAKFCDQCGARQLASNDSPANRVSRDVVIESFQYPKPSCSQSAMRFGVCEDDWDEFRKQVHESLEARRKVKWGTRRRASRSRRTRRARCICGGCD